MKNMIDLIKSKTGYNARIENDSLVVYFGTNGVLCAYEQVLDAIKGTCWTADVETRMIISSSQF